MISLTPTLLFWNLFVVGFPFSLSKEDALYERWFLLFIKMERVKGVSKCEGQFYFSKFYPSIAFSTSLTFRI